MEDQLLFEHGKEGLKELRRLHEEDIRKERENESDSSSKSMHDALVDQV